LKWRSSSIIGEGELPAEEEHQSVEDIGTGTSQASHRQGRVRRLLTGLLLTITGTNYDSLLLRFPLLLPLTMVATSLWESRKSLHCAVIGQKQDHPNLASQLFQVGMRQTPPPRAASPYGNPGLGLRTRSRRRSVEQRNEVDPWSPGVASTTTKPQNCSRSHQRHHPHRWTERRSLIQERKEETIRKTATSQSARPHSTWKPGLQKKAMSSTQSWSPTPTRGTSTERPRRKAR